MSLTLRNSSIKFCLLMGLSLSGTAALSFDQPTAIGASVKLVEPTAMPDAFYFQLDTQLANCPARAWVMWDGGINYPRGSDEVKRQANIKATYAALLTAVAAGKKVNVYARNAPSGGVCVGEFVHVLD